MNRDHANPPDANKPATVVYACSGCSDVGEIADRVARQLTREGAAKKIISAVAVDPDHNECLTPPLLAVTKLFTIPTP